LVNFSAFDGFRMARLILLTDVKRQEIYVSITHRESPALINTLNYRDEAVLEAPPGAGKSTLVPLALLKSDGLTVARFVGCVIRTVLR